MLFSTNSSKVMNRDKKTNKHNKIKFFNPLEFFACFLKADCPSLLVETYPLE